MKQKHYIDIENLREEDTELRQSNAKGFEVGDIISITEKIDGSNLCICYDSETDSLKAFSWIQELSYNNTLSGAWNLTNILDIKAFKAHPSWRIFGEWSGARNKILYDDRFKKKWVIFDIYDTESEQWLSQDTVKDFCKEADLEYIHELYNGEFISWEHVRSFLHSPNYGERQEGVVVKNQSKLSSENSRLPSYLKIVNDDFKESMKHHEKVIDHEKEQANVEAMKIVESIVTRNRVEKELFKMRDEGIIPEKLHPKDMTLVAKSLPKRVYDDCVKEEKELVVQCGEYFGKMCGQQTMKFAKEIILGG